MALDFSGTFDIYEAEQLVQDHIHTFRTALKELIRLLNPQLFEHQLESAVSNLIINPEFITLFYYLRNYHPGAAIHYLVNDIFSGDLQEQRGRIQTLLTLLYPDDPFLFILEPSVNTPRESLEKLIIGVAEILLSVLRPDVDLSMVTIHFVFFNRYTKMHEEVERTGEYAEVELKFLDTFVEGVIEGQYGVVDFINTTKQLNIYDNPEVKIYIKFLERVINAHDYDAKLALPRQVEIVNRMITLEKSEEIFFSDPTFENANTWISLLIQNYRYKGKLNKYRLVMLYDRLASSLRRRLKNGFRKADEGTCRTLINALADASSSFPELIDFKPFLALIETSPVDGVYILKKNGNASDIVLGVLVLARTARAQTELIDCISDASNFPDLITRMKDRLRLMLALCEKITDNQLRLYLARKLLELLTRSALHDTTLEEFIENDLVKLIGGLPKSKFQILLAPRTQVHRRVAEWLNREA